MVLTGSLESGCYLLGANEFVTACYSIDERLNDSVVLVVKDAHAALKTMIVDDEEVLALAREQDRLAIYSELGQNAVYCGITGSAVKPPSFSHVGWVPFDGWSAVDSSLHATTTEKDGRPTYQNTFWRDGAVWTSNIKSICRVVTSDVRHRGEGNNLLPVAALKGVSKRSKVDIQDDSTHVMLRVDGDEIRVIRRIDAWYPEADLVKLSDQWPDDSADAVLFDAKHLAKMSKAMHDSANAYANENPGEPSHLHVKVVSDGIVLMGGHATQLVKSISEHNKPAEAKAVESLTWYHATRAAREVADSLEGHTRVIPVAGALAPLVFRTGRMTEALYPLQQAGI